MQKENDDLPDVEEDLPGGDEWATMVRDGDHTSLSQELASLTDIFLAQGGRITTIADGTHTVEYGSRQQYEKAQKEMAKRFERRANHDCSKVLQVLRLKEDATFADIQAAVGKSTMAVWRLLQAHLGEDPRVRAILDARKANGRGKNHRGEA